MRMPAAQDDDERGPDEEELGESADDGASETVPCPRCGADVYEDAEQCPACGDYVSPLRRPALARFRWWWLALFLAAAAAVLCSRIA